VSYVHTDALTASNPEARWYLSVLHKLALASFNPTDVTVASLGKCIAFRHPLLEFGAFTYAIDDVDSQSFERSHRRLRRQLL
jgi:hypothetical protein